MATVTTVNSPSQNFFNFTLLCSNCKKNQKTFKIPLSRYDKNGNCILSKEEKEDDKWFFFCCYCGSNNRIDFSKICNRMTVLFLKK